MFNAAVARDMAIARELSLAYKINANQIMRGSIINWELRVDFGNYFFFFV